MASFFGCREVVILQGFWRFLGVWTWWICGEDVVDWVGNVVSGWMVFKGVWISQFFGIYFWGKRRRQKQGLRLGGRGYTFPLIAMRLR
jgi:hypothetical protein